MFPPVTLNNVAKGLTVLIVLGFFICGLIDILDYIIVKIILFGSTAFLFAMFLYILLNEEKNRSEN